MVKKKIHTEHSCGTRGLFNFGLHVILLWVKYSSEEYPQLLECAGEKRYLRHEDSHLYSVKEYFP